MEKSISIRLLTETLQKPFDEAQFRQFARNLVNDLTVASLARNFQLGH